MVMMVLWLRTGRRGGRFAGALGVSFLAAMAWGLLGADECFPDAVQGHILYIAELRKA
jgi:hypothetical protein